MNAQEISAGTRAPTALSLIDRFDQKVFNALYARSLVYNTCWEDPAVDRQALRLTPDDVLLVIGSAGCNVLDYALQAPRAIHAVDANPRQNALLELKIAAIRHLDLAWLPISPPMRAFCGACCADNLAKAVTPSACKLFMRSRPQGTMPFAPVCCTVWKKCSPSSPFPRRPRRRAGLWHWQ
jgi:hypothetical protein